ncbi:MAG: hypothetical protein LBF51_06225 [Zoogloeaceae bacterium]|nr:hypothetical protein [Zoogloeaceae bacterium]
MRARREKGVVLVMGLILLIMVMMLGVAAIRTITLQERLAGASVDYNNAFQAAETALRAGEATIKAAAATDIARFYKRESASLSAPDIVDLAQGFSYWKDHIPICGTTLAPCATVYPLYGSGDPRNPRFIIEKQGSIPGGSDTAGVTIAASGSGGGSPPGGGAIYKITAIGWGIQMDADIPVSDVVLQTTYTR